MTLTDTKPAVNAVERRRLAFLAALPALYLLLVYIVPRPEAVSPAGWRLTGLFVSTIAGLILQPLPGGALVLIAVALSTVLGGLSIDEALDGYAYSTVWLVLCAFFISRAIIKTGLARRIALFFVRLFGTSSLGLCYALSFTDMVLASIIPSNAARSGGVILPITRSIAELYESRPGPSAALLGGFLMAGVYQGISITSAMFFTGQASNPLLAEMAGQMGFRITWASWALAGIVPGMAALLIAPLIVRRLLPPVIRRTPEASAFAAAELSRMGPWSRSEKIVCAVFATVCGLWVTSGWHGLHITTAALFGASALIVSGVLTFDDIRNEKAAWELFLWYGGILRLGQALNDSGVTTEFAKAVGAAFSSYGWPLLFAVALLVYFYAHYGFASITAHILAMYPPFVTLLVQQGAPLGLMAFSFGCFVCFAAGLTHYGTTPAPMFFAQDYVSLRQWWIVGFFVSVANLSVWSLVGFTWWKLIGVW